MAELIRMPKMSDTMTEGVIAEWHKKVGDTVKSGDVLAEVETDKATMDLEAYEEGTLLYIGVEKGEAVPIDGIMAIIGAEGEDYKALLNGESGGSQDAPKADASADKPDPVPAPSGNIDKADVATNLPDPEASVCRPRRGRQCHGNSDAQDERHHDRGRHRGMAQERRRHREIR